MIIEQMLKEKKVLRKGAYYVITGVDGENIRLASRKDEAEKMLIEMGYGKSESDQDPEELITEVNEAHDSGATSQHVQEEDPSSELNTKAQEEATLDIQEEEKSETEDEDAESALLEQVGNFEDYVQFAGQSEDVILVYGIDSRLKSHPVIQKVPVEFRWRTKENNVDDIIGSQSATHNKEYVVLRKNDAIRKMVKVMRDDTPSGPFFVRGEMVLCVVPKKYYEEKKQKQLESFHVKNIKSNAKRKDLINKLSRMSDGIESLEELMRTNQSDRAIESQNAGRDGIRSIDDISKIKDPQKRIHELEKLSLTV